MPSINIERVGANSKRSWLGFIKFQISILLVSFGNYSLFFLSLKYRVDIKSIWQI